MEKVVITKLHPDDSFFNGTPMLGKKFYIEPEEIRTWDDNGFQYGTFYKGKNKKRFVIFHAVKFKQL
jgi:hypothetical protein